jgi:MYXO-CTERM domain-containing protein
VPRLRLLARSQATPREARRFLPGLLVLAALAAPAVAHGDIGITRVSPMSATPGQPVKVEIGCGWPKGCPERIPVSLVASRKVPEPHPCGDNALCSPTTGGPPRQSPYVFLGRATRTARTGYLQSYELRVEVPNLRPGPYAFVGYVPFRHPRAKGTLISSVPSKKPFQVAPEINSADSQANDSHTNWLAPAAGALAILAAAAVLRRRRSRMADEPTPSVSGR